MHQFIDWVLATVHDWGYLGIFVLMGLESTVLPVPSEAVLIPAGYLAYQGRMSFVLIVLAATLGSLAGATLNYVFALWVGRPFLERYGRYFFVREALLAKLGRQIPLGTVGDPDDVAWAAVYLCSDEAKFVTGAELYIDGGISAQ